LCWPPFALAISLGTGLVIGLLIVLLIEFRRFWIWSLDQSWGEAWPVLGALLPIGIPLANRLKQDQIQTITVVALLIAIAVLQSYGQARNKRDRIKTEDRLNEQSSLLSFIAVAIAEQRDRIKTEDRFNQQSSLLNAIAVAIAEQGHLLRSLADGVAAEEEEEGPGEEGD
jgi:hypothetical protein